MSGFTVQPSDLYSTSSGAANTADQSQQIATTLANKLDAEGACWSDDDAGKAFAKQYVPSATQAILSMCATAQSMQSTADGLRSWAKNYVDVDQIINDMTGQMNGTVSA